MFRIGNMLIESTAMEWVPESVAMENGVLPIRFSEGRLHLLIADCGSALPELISRLEFILNKELVYEIGDPNKVREMVTTLYTMPHDYVARCNNIRFELACSQRWLELEETDSPNRRLCTECNEHVHLCNTEEEAIQHAQQGHCICFRTHRQIEVVESAGLLIFDADSTSPETQKQFDNYRQRGR